MAVHVGIRFPVSVWHRVTSVLIFLIILGLIILFILAIVVFLVLLSKCGRHEVSLVALAPWQEEMGPHVVQLVRNLVIGHY